ncbi:MAG TPA: thioredoxin domain-containing protein [Edaphobacter sp.]|nr:thioredoxin domain-containing protein [Edaphobacter sp.]
MLIAVKPIRTLIFALTLAAIGCHAETPAPAVGSKLSPDLARRVEVLIRSRSNIPPNYQIEIGPRSKSEIPGYDTISVTFASDEHTSKPITFLLSNDGKTLAQFSKYDISQDPKSIVSDAGRPARGGPPNAPVVIVGFDDLECPYCARMNAALFPALMNRYKNQVRIVYKDFPLSIHAWAMRAAIDVDCMAAQSHTGYWNLVDYIHAHAAEIGGVQHSVAKANDTLDELTRAEGKRQKVDEKALDACIAKQDQSIVRASMAEGDALGVDSTPALFINGERLTGAYPIEYVYKMIDNALIAAGQTPPPAPASPVQAKPEQTTTTPPAATPGR